MNTILNYFQFDKNLHTGGQPSEDEIRDLKNNGIEVLVNLSPSSTRNYVSNEAEIAENSKLIYYHIPVDCSNLQPHHFDSFKGVMDAVKDKNIFIHCGGNIKSSNLVHMYNVISLGADESVSYEKLTQIQQPEEKWFNYFKKFGMKGHSKN